MHLIFVKTGLNLRLKLPILSINTQAFTNTIMILRFRTDRPGQTVQTQIRLLLEEQSDLGLHCLPGSTLFASFGLITLW